MREGPRQRYFTPFRRIPYLVVQTLGPLCAWCMEAGGRRQVSAYVVYDVKQVYGTTLCAEKGGRNRLVNKREK